MKYIILLLSIIGCKFYNLRIVKSFKDGISLSAFKENMEIKEEDLRVEFTNLEYKENNLEIENKHIKELLTIFESYINSISIENKERILRTLGFLKEKILELEVSNRFYEDNAQLSNKNRNIATEKLKEIFYFLCDEKNRGKINRILEYLEDGFSNSGARTMLEIEKALYEVRQFSSLENKIKFLLNRSREMYLELSSAEEIYNKCGESNSNNPHFVSYLRNIMKSLLNLKEDYYSEEDFKFYENQFRDSPIDIASILEAFHSMYTLNEVIGSVEEYLSNEEIENYIRNKFENVNIQEFLANREIKIKTVKAILIDMKHLSRK